MSHSSAEIKCVFSILNRVEIEGNLCSTSHPTVSPLNTISQQALVRGRYNPIRMFRMYRTSASAVDAHELLGLLTDACACVDARQGGAPALGYAVTPALTGQLSRCEHKRHVMARLAGI